MTECPSIPWFFNIKFGQAADSCEQGNERSGPLKCATFLEYATWRPVSFLIKTDLYGVTWLVTVTTRISVSPVIKNSIPPAILCGRYIWSPTRKSHKSRSWIIRCIQKYFFMVLQPYWLLRLLRFRDHTQTFHPRYDSSGRLIGPSQRPLPHSTQKGQTSMRAAADPSLRPRGHWNRLNEIYWL